jgi:hypothetical protein
VVELLLAHGADPRAVSPSDSPLVQALEARRSADALRLLEAGAASERGTPVWLSALAIAARNGDEKVLAVLASRPGEPLPTERLAEAACSASDSGKTASLRPILELGAAPTTQCDDGLPLVARFKSCKDTQMLRLLIASGADVEQTSSSGNPPLQLAAHAGRADIAGVLLDSGADLGARGQGRTTALMVASQAGQLDVVALLLERGADIGDRNQKGQTARQIAELSGHAAVVAAIDEGSRGSGWFGAR